ncbi:phospho-N-acetylmuramoyl-pentapeptide-transferase [Tumidithrix helvetica PCC 7403]|uniref:phospho-N-acetylmuramoyl-pentapeptide- transferase n=1 Tax=Tumidithrix helvetica TaxID=3457545 RepID=UPI003C94B542
MVDTGLRIRKRRLPSGQNVSLSLALSIILLVLGIDISLNVNLTYSLLIPLFVCVLGVIALGSVAVPILRQLKTGQIVREDGPQAHLKKAGTPTMGGIFIIPVGIAAALVFSGFEPRVAACCILTLAFGLVGWLDDWQILRRHSNKGISPKTKLALQAICAIAFCTWMGLTQDWQSFSSVHLPLQLVLPLGILFCPLAIFVIMGTTNATNLTDGLDGLAGGTGAIALLGMAMLLFPEQPQLAIFSACMSGSYLGFLWFNRNPASVFMGDTGSLALGGALAAVALLGNMLWGLLIVGAIFVWESISVIAQVSYFKATKRSTGVGQRLFKMAPFHHHLELSGWHEIHVVRAFYIVGVMLVIFALMLKFL